MSASSTALAFSTDVVKSFKPSKLLNYHKDRKQITSIDFDDTGAYCITSAEDESIQLYDAKLGKHSKSIQSKKYGASLVRFTHHATNCIYASTKEDDTIRYLSLHDNKYIRYFKGHKATVDALEVSPLNDVFLSASSDNSIRLWDLRSSTCQGFMRTVAPSFLAFDPTAVLFSIGSEVASEVALYDVRNFDKQPFSTFKIPRSSRPGPPAAWDKIEFSNTGKLILIGTDGDTHYLLDSFTGELKAKLVGHTSFTTANRNADGSPRKRATGHISFTADGRFVFAGSPDKKIFIWDTSRIDSLPDNDLSLHPIKILDSQAPTSLLAFNPSFMLLATADVALTFWLPEMKPE
ncbi:hypothetical protein DV451_003689 [Geotrichum candidum]|uniref:Anaphase-promoting complex subunit 4 WD40 domain-containing protein n=1 Tax=Geotrichum candidum TaxID=1173061 RepID=A0A9P5G3V7_GEOCN|nr:hypothetical protein DV451_003689 [Geotrichum candidum]KAF5107522.1 hypothetical protein DV453_003052 [Geotrichum candidum]